MLIKLILRVMAFQSTYLYKVRRETSQASKSRIMFQSTYLYKVRLYPRALSVLDHGFNPRTYIRYDLQRDLP